MGYICRTIVPFYSVLYNALILTSFGNNRCFKKALRVRLRVNGLH